MECGANGTSTSFLRSEDGQENPGHSISPKLSQGLVSKSNANSSILPSQRISAPVAALHQAQLQMLMQKRWKGPYYWAAFTLQGEWN